MFINDDGLQIIPEEERQARIEFYADNSIGWTARPKHNHNGFIRKGKFKKVCGLGLCPMNQFDTLCLKPVIARCAIYVCSFVKANYAVNDLHILERTGIG